VLDGCCTDSLGIVSQPGDFGTTAVDGLGVFSGEVDASLGISSLVNNWGTLRRRVGLSIAFKFVILAFRDSNVSLS
jgi:hypothetical protein